VNTHLSFFLLQKKIVNIDNGPLVQAIDHEPVAFKFSTHFENAVLDEVD